MSNSAIVTFISLIVFSEFTNCFPIHGVTRVIFSEQPTRVHIPQGGSSIWYPINPYTKYFPKLYYQHEALKQSFDNDLQVGQSRIDPRKVAFKQDDIKLKLKVNTTTKTKSSTMKHKFNSQTESIDNPKLKKVQAIYIDPQRRKNPTVSDIKKVYYIKISNNDSEESEEELENQFEGSEEETTTETSTTESSTVSTRTEATTTTKITVSTTENPHLANISTTDLPHNWDDFNGYGPSNGNENISITYPPALNENYFTYYGQMDNHFLPQTPNIFQNDHYFVN